MNVVSLEEGARYLSSAARVSIVGCSGGGKTTLYTALAKRLDVSHIGMDREFFWLAGWVMRPRPDQRALIAEAVRRDRGVMDGTNPSSFDIRIPRSEVLIWVRMSRFVCLAGVLRRWIAYAGRARPEMAEGCPERIDLHFLRYIWRFETVHAPLVIANIGAFGQNLPVLMLKSRRDMRRLLDLVEASS